MKWRSQNDIAAKDKILLIKKAGLCGDFKTIGLYWGRIPGWAVPVGFIG